MSKTYRPWNPNQQWLLPPSVHDWLPQDDLVYFILDTVNELDISAITAKYEQEERGYPPYNPRMMVAVLFYAYRRGIFSSRKIMQPCEQRLTFRVIVGDDIPNFRTIGYLRKLHLKELEQLFVQVLQLCQKPGLVKLGHIALDNTKVKANASRHKAISYGRMKQEQKRLKQQIHQLLSKAEAVDQQQDKQYGADHHGDQLPKQLAHRESRLQRIQQAKKTLEAESKAAAEQARKERRAVCNRHDNPKGLCRPKPVCDIPADNKQYNFTDPESKIMKVCNKGWDQCANAQAAVDSHKQIIVACDVTNEPNDKRQFEPMLEKSQQNVGKDKRIKVASADTGYYSESNIEYAEGKQIDVYIATEKVKHNAAAMQARCGRMPKDLIAKQKMARKLRIKNGTEIYCKRKSTVEPVFGQIKRARGFVQFSLRGLEKMRGEWSLVCLTHNLLKLFAARYAVAA